jgi:hypothetical protein
MCVHVGIWVRRAEPFESTKTERKLIAKQYCNWLFDGAIRYSEYQA